MELRAAKTEEVRISGADDQRSVEGYGIVYDKEIELFPGFFEKISRGAFKKSLSKRETIKSYFNHDSDKVLSTTDSNPPLVLREDEKGVYYTSPIPPTSYGKDLTVNLQRNNVSGASFAFTVDKEDWEERKDGTIHRTVMEGQMYEIGPVTDPAYVQTGAALRVTHEKYEQRKKEFRAVVTTTSVPQEDDGQRAKNLLELETLKLQLEKESI